MKAEHDRRVALITGCGKARGIGEVTARVLSAAQVTVVVADIAPAGNTNWSGRTAAEVYPLVGTDPGWSGLESLVDVLKQAGGEASYLVGDVSDEQDSARMVRETLDRYGRLDILVNNAAAPVGADRADIEDVTLVAWERVISVNLRGTFLMSRAAVGPMRRRRYGRIVNVSSNAAAKGYPKMTAYTASKAGILGFTMSLAQDVAPWGITVNAIRPGAVNTTRTLFRSTEAEEPRTRTLPPLGRVGMPEDIAAAIGFFASESAGFITGQWLSVDGGMTMPPKP